MKRIFRTSDFTPDPRRDVDEELRFAAGQDELPDVLHQTAHEERLRIA